MYILGVHCQQDNRNFIDIVKRKKRNVSGRQGRQSEIYAQRDAVSALLARAAVVTTASNAIWITEFRKTDVCFFSDRRIYRHAEIERGIVKYSCGFTSVTWWSCARIIRERKEENNLPIFYFHSLYVIWLDFIIRDISTRNPLLYEWYTRNGPPNNLIAVLY